MTCSSAKKKKNVGVLQISKDRLGSVSPIDPMIEVSVQMELADLRSAETVLRYISEKEHAY